MILSLLRRALHQLAHWLSGYAVDLAEYLYWQRVLDPVPPKINPALSWSDERVEAMFQVIRRTKLAVD